MTYPFGQAKTGNLYRNYTNASDPSPTQSSSRLSDEERKTIVERYPAIQGLKYLCPVRTFIALKSHPTAVKRPCNKLLVNSKNPAKLLRTTTISTWLRNLMCLSTSQKPIPSVRSVASDLALAREAPLSDVVTMRNWSSTDVFNNHYRRQRLQRQNITNFVLRM